MVAMAEPVPGSRVRAVGLAVREARRARGVSLSELARRSGLGKATLSALENGLRNPTLDTLFALTTALGAPLGEVLRPHGPDVHGASVVARLCDRWELDGVRAEAYRIEVGEALQRSEPHAPGVWESLTVLSGRLRAGAAGSPDALRTLTAGQGVTFPGDRPHLYQGVGGPARAYLVMSYPAPDGAPGLRAR